MKRKSETWALWYAIRRARWRVEAMFGETVFGRDAIP